MGGGGWVRSGLVLLLAMLPAAGGCGNGDDTGGAGGLAPDTDAPTIVSVSPVDFAAGVSVISPVVVTFSEAIDPASATSATVLLTGVSGTVTASGNVATFAPLNNLDPDVGYTLQVSTGIRDLAGNTLAEPYTSQFHTAMVPNADAGADLVAGRGGSATLDGLGSAAVGGGNLTYGWSQLSGPDVGLLTGAQPSFAVPDSITTLSFELVVTEDGAPSAPDQVTVVVSENTTGAIFVSEAGDDGNSGAPDQSKASLSAAARSTWPTAVTTVGSCSFRESACTEVMPGTIGVGTR